MDTLVTILDWVGRTSAAILLLGLAWGFSLWVRGILPLTIRAGKLRQHAIAIFANSDNYNELLNSLDSTKLFNGKAFTRISTTGDLDSCVGKHIFIINWADWGDNIDKILEKKTPQTGLIVYALPGQVKPQDMEKLQAYNFVTVTNFRGRLITDLLTMALAISYARTK
jgi:hypothetical protein